MKKIIATVVAMFVALMLMAGPATANGGSHGTPEVTGKDVTLCHSGNGKNYTKTTVDINGWISGHEDHSNDIWAAFSYYERDGRNSEWELVNVPAQGNTDLLAFKDCEAPKEPTKVTPTVSVVDNCETKNDNVSVSTGEGYTSNVTKNGLTYTVTVTANEGFVLDLDNSWTVSDDGQRAQKVFTLTDEDCDLPETGGDAEYNTTLGLLALAGVGVLGGAFMLTRRRRS